MGKFNYAINGFKALGQKGQELMKKANLGNIELKKEHFLLASVTAGATNGSRRSKKEE